jgi:hypothetical protein
MDALAKKEFYLTKDGVDKLKSELDDLVTTQRPKTTSPLLKAAFPNWSTSCATWW